MRLSKLCTAVLSAAAFCASIPLMQAQAADSEEHQFEAYTYTFYDANYENEMDNTVSIDKIDFNKLSGDTLTIPERIKGYRVKQLNANLLKGSNYKKIVLPDCISWIGYQCFQDCTNLEEVEIFHSDARPDTNDGHSLISFNGYAFDGCTNLKKVTFSDRTGSFAYDVFKDCTSLETIELPENLEEIGSELFLGCTSLKEITIPDGVREIHSEAFYGCSSLKEVDVPASVKEIENSVFAKCDALEKVIIRNKGCMIKDPDDSRDFDTICKPTAVYGKKKSTAEYYAKQHDLTFIPLDNEEFAPEDYLTFEHSEYEDVYSVSGFVEDKLPAMIEIPATYNGKPVVSVGWQAFSGCKTIRSDEVSEGIKSIGYAAFYDSPVMEVKLPDSLNMIDESAFCYCSYLRKINLPEGMTCLFDETFRGCAKLTELTVPRSVERIKDHCFYYCDKLMLTVLNPYCSFDDVDSICTLVNSITAAEDSGAHAYAVKYNIEFISNGDGTPAVYRAQSVGYYNRIESMIYADIPGTLLADPDAYCELKIGGKTYTQPISLSRQYIEGSQLSGNTSELHRYIGIPIDPADAMKDGTFRLVRGDGTAVKSLTVKGTDVTKAGLNIKVYDYFDKVMAEAESNEGTYRLAKTAKDFCAATALYFDPDAGYTVSDDVKNLDQNVYNKIKLNVSGTKPENLELQFSTIFQINPFMRVYIKFSDNSYDSHTYKKGTSRQSETELMQNSKGEYYLDSETNGRSNISTQYNFVIDSYKVGIPPLYYAKLLAATGDERKVTLANAMSLYEKA